MSSVPSAGSPGKTEGPMAKQYREAKAACPEALLLFRMGDFYEAFDTDAEIAAKVLRLSVTRRGSRTMAGFPCHYVDRYLDQLVKAGHRVAVAEFVPGEGGAA